MKILQENTLETVQPVEQKFSIGGKATIADNRFNTVVQRKLKSAIQGSEETILTKPQGSAKFQQIASQMGQRYGVDTSTLKATHNSSFPARVNAEATIEGKNIHFAPGMDTEYNIKHEVAHAIDNTLHGMPKGDALINGHKIDTTREKKVDRMLYDTRMVQRKEMNTTEGAIPLSSDKPVVQRRAVDNSLKNLEAVSDPVNYVNDNAENNWFVVLDQYEKNILEFNSESPNTTFGANEYGPEVYGMNSLLIYRKEITERLLEDAVEPVKQHEENERKEFMKTTGESAFFHNGIMKKILINEPIRPLIGNVPGSTNPTSDIDVNLSGDGSEYAVYWLNQEFKNRYGNGRESGVVYDVNFYAQDFVPKKVFALKGNGELTKTNDEKYYDSDNWRTHQIKNARVQKEDEKEQEIASLFMMRVNMTDADWKYYKDQLEDTTNQNPEVVPQQTLLEVERRYTERNQRLNPAANNTTNLPADLGKIEPENREYEKVLEDEVSIARLRFEYWKSKLENYPKDTYVQFKTDRYYMELKAAKSKALAYANEAYYTQGAVIGVVVNKQILDNMYKNDRSTKFLKLKLTPAEYYHGFTEQIGFAFHSLNKAEGMDDLIRMGKYVHRAYNLFKHYCLVKDKQYTNYFSEEERRAASDWEGVKQGKEYDSNSGNYVDSTISKEFGLWNVLRRFTGSSLWTIGMESRKRVIKERLIELKIKFDRARTE
ncbi:hypothetical protein [Aquimarina litoralis]